MDKDILKVLKKYWGYDSLREGQLDIILSVLSGKDTVAILPTGGGKSLCYQLPAILNNKITIVISPLLALMKDQAYHLLQIGIKTVCLNSELKPFDQLKVLNSLTSYQIIYVTPEFLLANQKIITTLVASHNLGMIAIDEAHCASSWGHDFRPSYLRLGDIKALISANVDTPTKNSNIGVDVGILGLQIEDTKLPMSITNNIPILALTATAPPSVIKDIIKILKLENPATIIGDLGRKNLAIHCMKKTNTTNPALDLNRLIDPTQNTIIYTVKRDETDLIYNSLANLNPNLLKDKKMAKYHADLTPENKHDIYTKFITGEITILIATIAFGMGIDKKDIRMIINWGAPSNLETYYQEIGRAGRDGLASTCYLFWSDADLNLARFHVTETGPLAKESLRKINSMETYLRSNECRVGIIIRYLKAEFCTSNTESYQCKNCDNCTTYNVSPDEVDYGNEAFILFSLMLNLEVNYGSTMLISILRGSENKRMIPKLREMDSYGKGSNKSDKWWKSFIKFMISQNYITKVATNIQGHLIELLELSDKASTWLLSHNLKQGGKLLLRADAELMSLTTKKSNQSSITPLATGSGSGSGRSTDIVSNHKPIIKLNSSSLETINQIKSGKNIKEIAKARELSNVTIEGHFIMGLELDNELQKYIPQLGIDNTRIVKLCGDMKTYETSNNIDLEKSKLKDVKMIFDAYSYLEIKVAIILKKI